MGQIVFLYFIQKKGWLGVNAFPAKLNEREYKDGFYRTGNKSKVLMPAVYKKAQDGYYYRDNNAIRALSPEDETYLSTLVKGDSWGNGPKDFMRQIFIGCTQVNKNFFDDYLEPLFYTGLNKNRGDGAFFPPLHRRIPFLNGGLFEEMEGYDWRNNNFSIPNEYFSNLETKGRDADGILDVFDRYNFTMAEDEPMEREVAIDPEMLGKVFENLLDVKDRKSKGAFYTPREIVHYMCQESLINYLASKTGIGDSDIRKFILYGEYFRDEDTKKTLVIDNESGKVLKGDEIYRHKHHMEFDKARELEIPASIFSYKDNVNKLREIDDLLANVKIVDPAVGSGAFPLGMLNEIVKARDTITNYMVIDMNRFQRLSYRSSRSPYILKRDTIKNSIFACDIEASATDITKLRLWLSLVIDNQIMDQENIELGYTTKPRELPNLDCNIICGNSLVDSFHGIKLITENDALNNLSTDRQWTMYDQELALKINELIELQSKLYEEKDHVAKESLKDQIQNIYNQIILRQLEGSQDAVNDYYETINLTSKPFILWQLYFPRVFRDNGGFDIAIGNPPYIQLQKTIDEDTGEKLGGQYASMGFKTFAKTGDIYCLFYEKGYQLLRKDGVLSYITSNKWMRAGYGEKLRGFLAKETNPLVLIDFAGQKVFDSATVDVNIFIFQKSENKHNTVACTIKEDCTDNLSVYVQQHSNNSDFSVSTGWNILSNIETNIKHKIESVGIPLKDWDISINYGIKTGLNEAFIISTQKKNELIAEDPKSAELIRPILRGRDIKRYFYDFAGLWLINAHNGVRESNTLKVDINEYPAIKQYLDTFYDKLSTRADKGDTPYNLRNCAYMNDFFEPKIIFQEIVQSPAFALDYSEHFFCLDTGRIITGEHLEYLTAILNSEIFFFAMKSFLGGGGLGEKGIRMKHTFFQNFFCPIPDHKDEQTIKELVTSLQLCSNIKRNEIINSLDSIVYDIYKINLDEKKFIKKYLYRS